MRWTAPSMAATASGALTYSLGKSLYVPLTSRCNARTLPTTRGTNFLLPPAVVASLCRVRNCEHDSVQWNNWCTWLDTQKSSMSQKLPPALETVSKIAMAGDDDNDGDNATPQRPTVAELMEEIQAVSKRSRSSFEAIVIAGEGEPTLRWKELLQLTERLKEQQQQQTTILRVTTNGLAIADNGAALLQAAGVNAVSVALMTHDPVLYDELMQPQLVPPSSSSSSSEGLQAHERVCRFIQQAVQVGLQVEVTGVDRAEVNKEETEALAQSLGVTEPVRWRSYHPSIY
jgi:pyruvate-formate lyase-activating enzyme